jgi:hypothetical protein
VLLFGAGLFVADDDLALAANRPPISTTPSIFAISAASFGRRASKSSATRGRPPVMSLVFAILRGVFGEKLAGLHFLILTHGNVRAGGIEYGEHFLRSRRHDDLRVQILFVLDTDVPMTPWPRRLLFTVTP